MPRKKKYPKPTAKKLTAAQEGSLANAARNVVENARKLDLSIRRFKKVCYNSTIVHHTW